MYALSSSVVGFKGEFKGPHVYLFDSEEEAYEGACQILVANHELIVNPSGGYDWEGIHWDTARDAFIDFDLEISEYFEICPVVDKRKK